MLNAKVKFVLLFLIFFGVITVNTQYTDADIFAERNVVSNIFTAKSLNFFARSTINNNQVNYLYKIVGIVPGGYDLAALRIKREGNAGFKYHLKTTKINGDDTFCNSLNVQVLKRDFTSVFSGKLMDLALNSQLDSNDSTDWIFFLSLDQSGTGLENKICEFNFDFKSYDNSPDEKGGIYAQRLISNVVSSGSW